MKVKLIERDGERGLLGMVELVQATYAETMPLRDEGGLARLEQALHRQRAPWSPGGSLRMFAAAAAMAALVLVGGTVVYRHFDKVTFEVMNGSIGPGGFVRPTSSGTAILFSEGSELTLGATARARVDTLTANGGRVVIENGSVHARIVPRKHARWSVEAGPYTIRVTGTAFNVKWSWEEERLDVAMDHGSVIVTGPLARNGVTLTGGMKLSVNPWSGLSIGGGTTAGRAAAGGAVEGRDGRGDEPREEPSADDFAPGVIEAVPAGAADRGRTLAGAPGRQVAAGSTAGSTAVRHSNQADRRIASNAAGGMATPTEGAESWDRQLAAGNALAILNDAEARGIDRVLVTVSGHELSALADAARYGHRPALARRVLLSLRARFPRGPEARDAAFFLGGLAEDAGGPSPATGQAAALDWYTRYLNESPHGRYLAQALGRKMVMTQKLNGNDAARAVAAEYLERFPGGPYASAARKLTRAN